MNTTINIIAASVFGVGISAGAVLYIGTSHQAKQIVPTPAPVVVPAPEPVVVNSVIVKDRNAITYTVMEENIRCWSGVPLYYEKRYTNWRMCKVNGVKTDLVGYSEHTSQTAQCFTSKDGGYSWDQSGKGLWACDAIYKLGAS